MPRGPPPPRPRPPPIGAPSLPPNEPPPPYPGPPVQMQSFATRQPPPPYPHGPTHREYFTPGQPESVRRIEGNEEQHTSDESTVVEPNFSDRTALTIQCPACQATVLTTVLYKTTSLQWVLCTAIALVGGCLGCCLIPFFIDGLGDVEHICPNCKSIISKGPAVTGRSSQLRQSEAVGE